MKYNRVIAEYQVTYECGITQVLLLITNEDWYNLLKPIKTAISLLEDENKGRQTEPSLMLKKAMKLMFHDEAKCFPIGGPLHQSIQTGFLDLPPHQGGTHKVQWRKIK